MAKQAGGYANPQRVTDRSFNALVEGGKALTNKIATTASQITQNVKLQKEQMQREQDELDIEMQSMFSKVNELPSTTNSTLDNNIHSFWNGQVDDYFKIKNDMDNGTITRQEGNRKLAQINGLVGQFKTQAKYLGEQCALYSDSLNNQQVSSTGSVVNKNFLQALCKGGDVRTVMKDGQLVYQLGEEGQFLNGTELIAKAGADKNLFNKKADFTDYETQMYNKLATPDSPDSEYLTTETFRKGMPNPITGEPMNNLEEGYEYTMQYIIPDKKDSYLQAAYNSPMMNVMLQDEEAMLSEWQDNIPDGWDPNANNGMGGFDGNEDSIAGIAQQVGIGTQDLANLGMTMDDFVNSSWHEYPTDFTDEQKSKLNELQDKVAKTYIARQSYNNNGLQLGALKTKDKKKISPPPSPSNNSSSAPKQYQYGKGVGDQVNTLGGAYDDTVKAADQLYAQGTPTVQQILDSLTGNPAIDEQEHDFYIGDGSEEGGKAGVLYHNGVPVSMNKFKTKKSYEDYVLRQTGMKPETIGHFRNKNKSNPPKAHTFATKADYYAAVNSGKVKKGDQVTVTDSPPSFIQA